MKGYSPRRGIRVIRIPPQTGLAGHQRYLVEGPLRIVFRPHDLAVAHVDDAVAVLRGLGIVRDHQHGLAEFLIREPQHAEHDVGVLGIQVARGLVGQHDGRLVDERARQSYALLLASGKLGGTMPQTLGQAEKIGDAVEVRGIAVAVAGNFAARSSILRTRVERRQQVEFLEDESDLALAHAGALGVGERGQVVAIEHDAAAVGARQSAQKIEQRGLAAARRADHADELALLHAEGNSAQRLDLDFADVIGLAQVFCFDECVGHA